MEEPPSNYQGWDIPCCKIDPFKTEEDKVGGACYVCDMKYFTLVGKDKKAKCCKYNYEKNGKFLSSYTEENCCPILNEEKFPACEARNYLYNFRNEKFADDIKPLSSYINDGYLTIKGATITLVKRNYSSAFGWENQTVIDKFDNLNRVTITLKCPKLNLNSPHGVVSSGQPQIILGYLPIGKQIDLTQLYFIGGKYPSHPISDYSGSASCNGYMFWHPATYGSGWTEAKEALVQYLNRVNLSECIMQSVKTVVLYNDGKFFYPWSNGSKSHWEASCLSK